MTSTKKLTEFVSFNPKRTIKKGETKPFVEMAALTVDSRDILEIGSRTYKGGGSRFQDGDTLFARITPCLENGKTAKTSGLGDGVIAHGSTEFIVLTAKEPEYDEDYVYYLARMPEFRSYAKSRMEGTSGRQRVSWQSLAEFEFDFPDKEERREIGRILKSIDDKIQVNNILNQTLGQIAQAIFKSWFVDFEPVKAKMAVMEAGGTAEQAELAAMSAISAKDEAALKQLQAEQPEAYAELAQTAALFPSTMEESELGDIPAGWDTLPLDEIAHYQNGLALQKFRPKNENVFLPVVKIAQLKKGFADGEEKASPDIKPECIIDDGDVVFSWSGSLVVDIWCGGKAALNQHLFKVTSETYPKWFYHHFTKHHLAEFQRIAADKAVTMGHIKREHLASAKCAIPTDDILLKGTELIGSPLEEQIQQRLETNTLAETRDSLLPKLLSGDLPITITEVA